MLRLISTDFDGTLVGFEPWSNIPGEFFEWVKAWKIRTGGQWMINTGRWIESVEERVIALRMPFRPDWVGCGEREVYQNQGSSFEPLEPWNRDCTAAHERLKEDCREAFEEIQHYLKNSSNADLLFERQNFAGALAESSKEADAISAFLERLTSHHPEISYARNDVYFRFCHRSYHKGACIREVQRLTGVAVEETFACGDHYNDLPMLRVEFAGALACPANAIPEVKAAVKKGNGFLATKEYGPGLVQGLRHFEGKA